MKNIDIKNDMPLSGLFILILALSGAAAFGPETGKQRAWKVVPDTEYCTGQGARRREVL